MKKLDRKRSNQLNAHAYHLKAKAHISNYDGLVSTVIFNEILISVKLLRMFSLTMSYYISLKS